MSFKIKLLLVDPTLWSINGKSPTLCSNVNLANFCCHIQLN